MRSLHTIAKSISLEKQKKKKDYNSQDSNRLMHISKAGENHRSLQQFEQQ